MVSVKISRIFQEALQYNCYSLGTCVTTNTSYAVVTFNVSTRHTCVSAHTLDVNTVSDGEKISNILRALG